VLIDDRQHVAAPVPRDFRVARLADEIRPVRMNQCTSVTNIGMF
jgi:hypothetical protein